MTFPEVMLPSPMVVNTFSQAHISALIHGRYKDGETLENGCVVILAAPGQSPPSSFYAPGNFLSSNNNPWVLILPERFFACRSYHLLILG